MCRKWVIPITEKYFYRLGICLLVIGIIVSILQNTGSINLSKLLYPCLFHRISGLFCPGCGGTRAFTALLRGHIISCFVYHPFVFYCFVMYVLFMTSHTLEKISKKAMAGSHAAPGQAFLSDKKKAPCRFPFARGLSFRITYVYLGIVIILLQWMLKNLFLLLERI